jgi:dolichyl-phosphate-mannose--protein O-mannosyl transferase
MSRQLFIHHYLPSHLASALVAGSVLHFLLSETIDYPISIPGHFTRRRPPQWAELGARGPVIVAGFFITLLFAFIYLAPLTYGTPGYVSPISDLSICATYAPQFADWMAKRSTLSDCCRPGHFTLPPSRSRLRDHGRIMG